MATSVATPLERRLGTIAGVNEMTSSSQVGSARDQPAVRPVAQHRRRGARGAGGDQRLARRPAGDAAQQPDLPQGEPVRRAGDHPGADLEDDVAGPDLRRRLEHRQPAAGAGRRRRRRRDRRRLRCRRCASSCCRSRSTSYGISAEDVRAAIQAAQRQPAQGRDRGRRAAPADLHADAGARAPPTTRRWSSPGATARRCGSHDVAEVIDGVENTRTLGLFNGEPAVIVLVTRQPGANVIETVDGVRALLPELQAQLPARHRAARSPPTAPTRSAPRCTRSRSRC